MTIIKSALTSADRGHVLQVLATFAGKTPSQWLPVNHPASKGALPLRWNDVRKLTDKQLIEAIAISAPNHCIDGWSYASRAVSSLLAGDLHAARHLAYYAQLRAGLSMLSHLGIGIFNGSNFAVDRHGAVTQLDDGSPTLGTHKAVWQALQMWVSDPATAKEFLSLVRIGPVSLKTCLEAIWPGSSSTAIAGQLVSAWGVDLRRGESEHRARNMSSYNPQAFEPMPDDPADRLNLVENIWQLFEPTSASKFDKLDRSLLRSLFWQQHSMLSPGVARSDGSIARRYDELPASVRAIASKEFLLGVTETRDPKLLRVARMTTAPSLPTQMVARAFLLLRAATAFTVSNFSDAGVQLSDGKLRPWIDPIAEARGFWRVADPLIDTIDLWEDIRLALEDLAASKKPAPSSLNEWIRKSRTGMPIISEAERIGVWSFTS